MRFLGQAEQLDDLETLSGNTARYSLSRSSVESRQVARELALVIGQDAPVIEHYLDALSFAPASHLEQLARREAAIVFSPTIADALTSDRAANRRGRLLDLVEIARARDQYGPGSGVAAVYDPDTDWLVFPTAYCSYNLKRTTLHELGHALTVKRAEIRPSLLERLPRTLGRHVFSAHYVVDGDPDATMRNRVHEALAEGYILLISGRGDELPAVLSSELVFMLQTVDEGGRTRIEFEDADDRDCPSSQAGLNEIVDATDPEYASLFASLELGTKLEPWRLVDNELAERRRLRRA